ncbi:hypothetical protein QVD17_04955 [Tagetes erecta]|uniref:DUF7787 domain-containing protein n=1 Tax=Tagetes erecta TaxID=13708 RepID=A0AAD8P4Z6_TARER|nr:hypothetical protein QVD17_04955 [Tagetes erecta]
MQGKLCIRRVARRDSLKGASLFMYSPHRQNFKIKQFRSAIVFFAAIRLSFSSLFVISAMASQGALGKPLLPKLTLEDYLNLEHMDVISIDMLRKVLMMHGFKSLKIPKNDLKDAVRSIELMKAHHSTLQSDVSSNAFLCLDDVIKDLSLLQWHECCITSIETINPATDIGSDAGEESSRKRLKSNGNMASSSEKIGHEAACSSIVFGQPQRKH